MSTTTAAHGAGSAEGRRAPGMPAGRRISRRVASDLVEAMDAAAIVAGTWIAGVVAAGWDGALAESGRLLAIGLLAALVGSLLARRGVAPDPARLAAIEITGLRRLLAALTAHSAVVGLVLPASAGLATLAVALGSALATSAGLAAVLRLACRRALARLAAAGAFDSRVAVYGSGLVAARVAAHLCDRALGVAFAGRFDDRTDDRGSEGSGATGPAGSRPVAPVGSLDALVEAGRSGLVDHIIIALPQSAVGRTETVLRHLDHLPVRVSIVTHIASDIVRTAPAHRVQSLGPVGLLAVKAKPLDGWSTLLKTAEDYLVGTAALIVALPVLALVAIAVRLDSPGPVLFRQRRRGLNGRVFEVLKFRTMRVMEDGATVTQATRGDPRVTHVGRFLRASSLDELPQLVNVLRGEMSLVGPRPHAVAHDDRYAEEIRRYPSRQQVKPGITGLAQVRGFRGETETPEKMQARLEQDLAYIEGWSLWLDVRILALTIVRVWSGPNAY